MEYKLGVNPGYAGTEGTISGLILNRYQWVGFDGASKTLVFSANAAVNAFGAPGGIGINVVDDQLGFAKNTQVNINYSYIKSLKFGDMGIGLSFGLANSEIKPEGWTSSDDVLNNTAGGSGDPWIPQGEVSQMALDLGFGLYLKTSKYFLGASVTHINQASIQYNEVENYLSCTTLLFNGWVQYKIV